MLLTRNLILDMAWIWHNADWGKENAATAQILARRRGVNLRTMMDIIKRCRDHGLPLIGSKDGRPDGFFFPVIDIEAYASRERAIREINSAISTINATSRTVEMWIDAGLIQRTTVPQPTLIDPLTFSSLF